MNKKIILVLFMGICSGYVHAQSNPSEKFAFTISAGPAFPVGVFAKKDIADAVIYEPDRNPAAVSSITKSKSGFAKVGYSIHAELSYKFSKHFYTFIRSGATINPISVSEMEDFFMNVYGVEQRFSHVNNELFTATPGLGYSFQKDKWRYNAGIFLGYGKINYPYYENALIFTGSNLIWAHSGQRPDLSSWVSGGLVQVTYEFAKFSAGLDVLFQRADFDYMIFPRTIPGGSQSQTFDDTIKTRILSVGLVVRYSLSSTTD